MSLVLHIDGGSRGNPGPAGGGVVLAHADGRRVHEGAYFFGSQTNNAAEYMALLRGIERAAKAKPASLLIHSDSELLVKQMTGEYRVKSPSLAALHEQAEMALIRVARWSFKHVRREFNRRADELANIAMDEGRDRVIFDVDDPPAGGADLPPVPGDSATRGPRAADSAMQVGTPTPSSGRPEPGATEPSSVRVAFSRRPSDGMCPAGDWLKQPMMIGATLPAGVCVHAAHAILPTLLSIQSTLAGEVGSLPIMTVRCPRPECGATFHVGTPASSNGSGR